MTDEEKEVIDSQDDTQNDTEDTNKTTLTVDDYNRVVAERDAEKARNAKLYARIEKDKQKSLDNKPLVQSPQDNSHVTQELARLKLKVDHGISDPEAIDFIMKNGGEKALENPYIKGTIDAMIQQKKAESAVISDDTGISIADKHYSDAELKAMPSEELEKLLPHV